MWIMNLILLLLDLPYEDRLKILNLPSLCYRRVRGDMIEVFKITHNFYDSQVTKSFFQFADSITRSNGYKITKVQCNTTAFQHFFTNRVVNCWNSLPRHVVNVDTINAFKNSLDRHLSTFIYDKRVTCDAVTSMRAWRLKLTGTTPEITNIEVIFTKPWTYEKLYTNQWRQLYIVHIQWPKAQGL